MQTRKQWIRLVLIFDINGLHLHEHMNSYPFCIRIERNNLRKFKSYLGSSQLDETNKFDCILKAAHNLLKLDWSELYTFYFIEGFAKFTKVRIKNNTPTAIQIYWRYLREILNQKRAPAGNALRFRFPLMNWAKFEIHQIQFSRCLLMNRNQFERLVLKMSENFLIEFLP